MKFIRAEKFYIKNNFIYANGQFITKFYDKEFIDYGLEINISERK